MKTLRALLLGTALSAAVALAPTSPARAAPPGPYQHVLIITIDGLHAVDLANWARLAKLGSGPSAIQKLISGGTVFSTAYAPVPSNDFPGLLAIMTGGTPRSTGVYGIDSFDRKLLPPVPSGQPCPTTPGTEVDYGRAIDVNSASLGGGGTAGQPMTQIDPAKLPLQSTVGGCTPVYPHGFLRTNTLFEVVHAQGYRTAWADDHPGYEILNGPSGSGVDDLYLLEANAVANGTTGTDYTQTYADARTFDGLKVNAVINEINGKDSTGTMTKPVPTVFGLNFTSLGVAQQLPSDGSGLTGGYASGTGTWKPTGSAFYTNFAFIDSQIGLIQSALFNAGLQDSTLIVLSAKFGNSPINKKQRFAVNPSAWQSYGPTCGKGTVIPPNIIKFGAFSDLAVIWLDPAVDTQAINNAMSYNYAECHANALHMSIILNVFDMIANYGVSPIKDSRVPDFMGIPYPGIIYTIGKELSSHGNVYDTDLNVGLVIASTPNKAATTYLPPSANFSSVETRQIAPTVLQALGLDPNQLQSVSPTSPITENTQPLPITFPSGAFARVAKR